MRIGVVILARMNSSRLPGKVLRPFASTSVLGQTIRRARAICPQPTVIVATTVSRDDDIIAEEAQRHGAECIRGSDWDIFSRCQDAVERFDLDAFFRLGADCPLFDFEGATVMLRRWMANPGHYEFMSNTIERSFPLGFDIELWSRGCLKRLGDILEDFKEAEMRVHRGSMVSYILPHIEQFNAWALCSEEDSSHFRVTLDTPEDYEVLSIIGDTLFRNYNQCTSDELVSFLEENPHVSELNRHVMPRTGYWTRSERLKVEQQRGRQFVPEVAL